MGQVVEWDDGLQEAMIEYFTVLFLASNTNCGSIIYSVSRSVTDEQNEFLLLEIEQNEFLLIWMGLSEHMVNLFIEYMRSIQYQICHASKEFGTIIPFRGIRQGDPLSSYLFLICIKGFTSLIRDYERRKMLKGIQVARGAPSLTYLFFGRRYLYLL